MRLTGSFVLPKDAQLQPASELSEELRRSSGAADGDFALSRKNSRAYSKIVDAAAAQLIRQFEKPSTIAVAVARFSRTRNSDTAPTPPERIVPEQILEDALPLLRSLIGEGLLVEAASTQALPTTESLASGNNIDGWLVTRCIQSLEDTELYLVRGLDGQWGALKIGRPGDARRQAGIGTRGGTARQQSSPTACRDYWRQVYGGTGPTSSRSGSPEQTPKPPPPKFEASAALKADGSSSLLERRFSRPTPNCISLGCFTGIFILAICSSTVRGSSRSSTSVWLRELANPAKFARAGVSFFFEPEFARASLQGLPPPAASFAGEQYALASLLYLLLTGTHTQDFALERREMLAQIATGAMTPLARRGIESWPPAEQVLARALSKDPADRYPSTRAFAQAWRTIDTPDTPDTSPGSEPEPDSRLRELRPKY